MSIVTTERLEHELAQIKKKLSREKETEEKAAIRIVKAKIAKAESHLDFVKGQTEARLKQAIEQCQAKQVQLIEQIEVARRWERFYTDMLLNHPSILADAKAAVTAAELRLGELTGSVPTVENVNAAFERIMQG